MKFINLSFLLGVEKLIYIGRDPRLGYVYVRTYEGLVKSAYVYVKRGKKRMEYFAVLTSAVAKAFYGEIRRKLAPFIVDRVERAVKSFIASVEEALARAARGGKLYYALRSLYGRLGGYVADVGGRGDVAELLNLAAAYLDLEAMWREAAGRHGVSLPLEKALKYTYI